MAHFSSSLLLLSIYNLLSQVYALAKFQPHMTTTFGVTALQSSNNRKSIYTASIGKSITCAYKNGCNLQLQCNTKLQLTVLCLP